MVKIVARRAKWLVVVPTITRPDHAGGDRRLFEILKRVALTCDVDMLPIWPANVADQAYILDLQKLGIRVLAHGIRAGVSAMVRQGYDAIFFEFYYTTHVLLRVARRVQPQAMIIVDSVDIHYLRERAAAHLDNRDFAESEATKIRELAVYRQADVTIAVSETEKQIMREEGISSTFVIPIIVSATSRSVRERAPEVVFIGGFNHMPNRMAVQWFHRSIWPLVRQRISTAAWVIAGSNAPPEVTALDGSDGIRVLGFVPSTEPLLDSAQVSVAPLTFGAGMKSKVCEALAAGIPVVTTKWGAQGLEHGQGSAFIVADDANDFANAVVLLLSDSDERARLSQGGQQLASQMCSLQAGQAAIQSLVQRAEAAAKAKAMPRRAFALAVLFLERRVVKTLE